MKFFQLSLLILLVAFVTGCKDDAEDNGDCIQADWVDTYSGTYTCDGDSDPVIVTITASGDEIVIIYETDFSSVEFNPLTTNGCTINESASQSGITLTLTGTLDGDNLSLTDVLSTGSSTSTCVISATRN